MLNYYQLLFYFPTTSVGIFGNFQKKVRNERMSFYSLIRQKTIQFWSRPSRSGKVGIYR